MAVRRESFDRSGLGHHLESHAFVNEFNGFPIQCLIGELEELLTELSDRDSHDLII